MDSIAGWADLDKGNIEDGHYQKRPPFVYYAEEAFVNATNEHDRALTAFEERRASYAHVDAAASVVNALADYTDHCRKCWHEGKERPDESLGEFLVKWEVIRPETPNSRIDLVKLHALERELLPVPGYTTGSSIHDLGL